MIEDLFEELSNLPQIEAIALGGSRAGTVYDEKSDYDVYLYCTGEIDKDLRRKILSKYCSYMEINNSYWETEDNCKLNNGIDIDILYRNLDNLVEDIASVVEQYNARNGYTTCMWHNLKTCKIIYDRDGRLKKAKDRFNIPYPEQLRKNIITRNMSLLHNAMPAYDAQIMKALKRNDYVSINHRVTAFVESYFDIIFAYNYLTHPGEKRLVQLCKRDCDKLPNNFEENLINLFSSMFVNLDDLEVHLKDIEDELNKMLKK